MEQSDGNGTNQMVMEQTRC